MIFKENNKAIYLQIADMICYQVLAGTLAAGARIPSVREYAASLEVNANTVMRSTTTSSGSELSSTSAVSASSSATTQCRK